MQDRFKFRHWDKRINEMFYPERNDNFGYYVHNSDIIETMQCTGLRDKNGKLIYEGDILRSEEYPFKNEESYNYAAEVLWDDASATFYYYTLRISTNVVGRAEGNTGNLNDYEWKVIGNRYENPELLED